MVNKNIRFLIKSIFTGIGYRLFLAGRLRFAIYFHSGAANLDPSDRAAWLVLGHSLRHAGRWRRAIDAYTRARQLPPFDGEADKYLCEIYILHMDYEKAWQHRSNVDGNSRAEPSFKAITKKYDTTTKVDISDNSLLIDVGDLINYILNNNTITGIQRVQESFVRSISHRIGVLPNDAQLVLPLIFKNSFATISYQSFLDILDARDQPSKMDRLFTCLAGSREIERARGAVLLTLGIPHVNEYFSLVKTIRQKWGWRFAAFVHDCIAISNPEYFTAEHAKQFKTYIRSVTKEADLFFVSTSETRDDLLKTGMVRSDIRIVPLAAFDVPAGDGMALVTLRARHPILERPFVLFVSTIEKRKNHALAIQCWKRLVREYGVENLPTLVLAGKIGWMVDEVVGELTNAAESGVPILHLSGLNDAEVSVLYMECLFSVYPSFKEGWGLPICESLAAGRPVVASRTAAMMEVGGSFADYADPGSLDEFYSAIERLLFDEEYRRTREKNIKTNYQKRKWNEFTEEILDRIAKIRQ